MVVVMAANSRMETTKIILQGRRRGCLGPLLRKGQVRGPAPTTETWHETYSGWEAE